MGRSPREVLLTLSAADINELRAYNCIQPIGDDRGELQAGLVASAVANVHGNKTKPSDFMVFAEKEPAPDEDDKRSREIAGLLGANLG